MSSTGRWGDEPYFSSESVGMLNDAIAHQALSLNAHRAFVGEMETLLGDLYHDPNTNAWARIKAALDRLYDN